MLCIIHLIAVIILFKKTLGQHFRIYIFIALLMLWNNPVSVELHFCFSIFFSKWSFTNYPCIKYLSLNPVCYWNFWIIIFFFACLLCEIAVHTVYLPLLLLCWSLCISSFFVYFQLCYFRCNYHLRWLVFM